MWEELAAEPIFVLTGDQDWAPPWALQRELEVARAADAPLHIFVTNGDPLVSAPPDGLSLGIHPNFLRGSSHGVEPSAVVEHCLALVPQATTARSHAFAESTPWLAELARRGIRADSNGCTMLQSGIVPVPHASGLLRFPVFLEDDVLLRWAGRVPSVEELLPYLTEPGLKILNFHPVLVALNARTPQDYLDFKQRSRCGAAGEDPASHPRLHGRGVADLLDELLAYVRRERRPLLALPELVRRGEELVAAAWPDGIFEWRVGSAW